MTDSNYFFCEKTGMEIAKIICVYQQDQIHAKGNKAPARMQKCRDCEQGHKNRTALHEDKVIGLKIED